MAISTAFQAQLDRLTAYVATLAAGPDATDATDAADTAALSAALDTAGAPPAAEPAPTA